MGLFRCIQIHFVDAQTQSHPGVVGRHPHGLPIHHLASGGGLPPLIAEALQAWIPELGTSTQIRQYIIDGTLAPCWSWSKRPELYSGKHRVTGVNLRVACTLTGHLAWVSKPSVGSVHDAKVIKEVNSHTVTYRKRESPNI